jgi:hypothetical protein
VIFVTLLLDRKERTEITRSHVRHVTEWALGLIGVVAAAVGAWMYYVPTNWFLGDLVESWHLGMFVGAGVLLAVALGVFARKAYVVAQDWTATSVWTTGLAVAALAGAFVFAMIWII